MKLIKVVCKKADAEVANKAGEYEDFTGTIDWKGTKAKVKDASFILLEDGKVDWYLGTWIDGIWRDGKWRFGKWEKGVWSKGTWKYGEWYSGTWKSGTWIDGEWLKGKWIAGKWIEGTSMKTRKPMTVPPSEW